jgi:hypothetical protein
MLEFQFAICDCTIEHSFRTLKHLLAAEACQMQEKARTSGIWSCGYATCARRPYECSLRLRSGKVSLEAGADVA